MLAALVNMTQKGILPLSLNHISYVNITAINYKFE